MPAKEIIMGKHQLRPISRIFEVPIQQGHGSDSDKSNPNYSQWTTVDGNKFFPSGTTLKELVPGLYEPKFCPQRGYNLEQLSFDTEGLFVFPDTNNDLILNDVRNFWDKEPQYRKYRRSYKCGFMMYGVAGSGKSSTVKLVMKDVFDRGGVAIKYTVPGLFVECVRAFRSVQPNTPLVVLMEELDSIIQEFGPTDTLNLLDGLESLDKVIFLATTNYPENLSDQFMNRPNRFAYKYKFSMPNEAARKLFFEHLLKETDYLGDVDKWVKDTKEMTIDYMNNLFVSVVILNHKYDVAIKRIRKMIDQKLSSDEDKIENFGFAGTAKC